MVDWGWWYWLPELQAGEQLRYLQAVCCWPLCSVGQCCVGNQVSVAIVPISLHSTIAGASRADPSQVGSQAHLRSETALKTGTGGDDHFQPHPSTIVPTLRPLPCPHCPLLVARQLPSVAHSIQHPHSASRCRNPPHHLPIHSPPPRHLLGYLPCPRRLLDELAGRLEREVMVQPSRQWYRMLYL
jgi:hypothetical protein